LHRIEIKLSKN